MTSACQHKDGEIDIAAAEQQMAHASLVAAVLKRRLREGGAAIISLAVRNQACPEPLKSQAFAVCLDAYALTSKNTFPIKDIVFLICCREVSRSLSLPFICGSAFHTFPTISSLKLVLVFLKRDCVQGILDTFIMSASGMGMSVDKEQVQPSSENKGILGLERDYEGGFAILRVEHSSDASR